MRNTVMKKQDYTASEALVTTVRSFNGNQSGVKFSAWVSDDHGAETLECTMFGANYTRLHDALKSDDEDISAEAQAEIVSIILSENGRDYLRTEVQ